MGAPFRADHVGSLLRPQELHEARAKHRRGEIDAAALKAVQDRCIKEVIALQESIGFPSITDGEFRRDWWHVDFLHGFDGVELAKGDAYGDAKFKGTEEQPPFMIVQDKIRRTRPNMLEHFEFLKANVKKGLPKFTMPSPAMLHGRADQKDLSEPRQLLGRSHAGLPRGDPRPLPGRLPLPADRRHHHRDDGRREGAGAVPQARR